MGLRAGVTHHIVQTGLVMHTVRHQKDPMTLATFITHEEELVRPFVVEKTMNSVGRGVEDQLEKDAMVRDSGTGIKIWAYRANGKWGQRSVYNKGFWQTASELLIIELRFNHCAFLSARTRLGTGSPERIESLPRLEQATRLGYRLSKGCMPF